MRGAEREITEQKRGHIMKRGEVRKTITES
jgi:hypothetical protein